MLNRSQTYGHASVGTIMSVGYADVPPEGFITHITGIRTPATMYKPVILHERLFRKCFITHNTGILTLATMYMLMFLDVRILTECIFTRITGIQTLATMYKLVSL